MAGNARANETQVAYHRRRAIELQSVRAPFEPVWRALAEYIEPSRFRGDWTERPISRDKIIDSTATFALNTLQSGMHSGITSPARPWFRLTTLDPELREYQPVKEYLSTVETRMREVFQASNVYNSFHVGYGDLGQFGQSVGLLVEDDDQVVRLHQLVHGQFWLARDERGQVTTLYRKFRWTVHQIVARFGYANVKRVSEAIATAYDNAKYDDKYDVWHAIEPRLDRNLNSRAKQDMPFLSNYWLDDTANRTTDGLLEESGFQENPIIAPAWQLAGYDNYGLSPGMVALGDIKMLQAEQKRKLEAIDKMVRPPMTGPTSMKNNPASLLPGSVTYVDDPAGKGGFRPAFEVRLSINELAADIRETQDRINRAFYADLFLMLSNMEGIQPRNQFEIAERKEEKLLALGPVLENIYNGQLEPVIMRSYAIMNRNGLLPPPPPDIAGQEVKIEYVSMLAQAQKAVATGSIERGVAFAGQLAAAKPDVLDKVDLDQAIDEYFDMLGVPPSIVVSDDEVAEVRQQRAQQQQAMQAAEMASQVAPAFKQGAEGAAVLADAQNNAGGAMLLDRLGLT